MGPVKIGLLVIVGIAGLCLETDASAKPTVECGATLTRSVKLDADLICGASALTITTPGVALNCSGHTIRGTVPGGIAVRVTAANVSVTDCTIEGFSSGINASEASGLKVAGNRFSNLGSAVRVDRSPRLALQDNLVESGLGFISIRDCPEAAVERNEFRPSERRAGSVVLERSPHARIMGNRSTQGVRVAVWRESDDSVVANNSLGGKGGVSVGRSTRVDVRQNSAGGPGPAHAGSIWGIELKGATDCDVSHNELSGVGIFLDPFDDIDGTRGADGNRIRENRVDNANFGILLFGSSSNVVERNVWSTCEIAVVAFPYLSGDSLPTIPTTDNDVRSNLLDSGSWGVYTANAGGNRYERNRIRGFAVGITEIATAPVALPDLVRENVISDNDYFGLLTEGASPVVAGNEFFRNGSADLPPPVLIFPYDEILLDARGGIGVFPWNGDAETTFDDGDSSNDVISEPVIGVPDEPNVFEGNIFADIYVLDTRPANAIEIATSNEFRGDGTTARVRQDWFGAIRVESTDGSSAEGATVDISDARGNSVATLVAGADGVAPDVCDPTRPMGRLTTEAGGPTPQWLRLSEYIINRDGNRVDLTPHQISVRSGELSGHGTYAWTGCADPECEVLRRYQLVDVTLGP
jgi:parallel beta-helix repeat protein